MAADWLKKAVFYEIYPQSFYDANGDGIGDINGIIEKLDYIKSLGCNALWINPWYDSPFKDAGYDVRDYYQVAQRYGTIDDAKTLFRTAHEKGIHVLIDLVPGHTSEEHPWFLRSGEVEENEFSHRYIWTENAFCRGDGMPFIGGEQPRDGTYIINFFKSQPALNYGWREIHEPSWQHGIHDPAPMQTRQAMKDIMRFWLDLGCDGFRVDMADSLVKNDGSEKLGTMEVWKDINGSIHAEYPDCALVSEWNNPRQALNCGFDMDFYLDWYGNGYSSLVRYYKLDKKGCITDDQSYFKAESHADIHGFLKDYLPQYESTKNTGLWCLITGNHDCKRTSFNLTDTERRLFLAFLLTMPGAPYLYYGDEIGMAYRWLPTKEGGYHRTGSRTPMQWTSGSNMGFSTAQPENLYLPVDPTEGAANVASQDADPHSLLNHVRKLIQLRQNHDALGNYSPLTVYRAEPGSRLFAYKRGDYLVAVNPGLGPQDLVLDGEYEPIYVFGNAQVLENTATLQSQSFLVLKPCE